RGGRGAGGAGGLGPRPLPRCRVPRADVPLPARRLRRLREPPLLGRRRRGARGRGGAVRPPRSEGRRRMTNGPPARSIPPLLRDLVLRATVPLDRILGSRTAGTIGILMYHRVTEPCAGVPQPTFNVTPRRFREQLAGLL